MEFIMKRDEAERILDWDVWIRQKMFEGVAQLYFFSLLARLGEI